MQFNSFFIENANTQTRPYKISFVEPREPRRTKLRAVGHLPSPVGLDIERAKTVKMKINILSLIHLYFVLDQSNVFSRPITLKLAFATLYFIKCK